jgi:tRNA(Arg) A34 adenosine deaminase TadA
MSLPSYTAVAGFMELAIHEALRARAAGDYAIGAVVTLHDCIIASSGNRIVQDTDPTQHAEIAAIRMASQRLGTRHLRNCVLYTTHEPCPMCTAAAIWARMNGIVSGATIADMTHYRLNRGNDTWTWRTISISANHILLNGDPTLFHIDGFLRDRCAELFHDA